MTKAGTRTRRKKPIKALHAIWDYEDRRFAAGQYALPDRRRTGTVRHARELLVLLAVWATVLGVVLTY